MPADLIIINSKVITVDRNFSIAQAVAVKGERIIAIGTNNKIRALAGRHTKIIDLKGKTLLPGINDAHIHATLYWGSRPPVVLDVGYPKVKSIRDILNVVRKKAQEIKPGEWIRGTGLNLATIEECKRIPARYPTRWDLDLVSPANPVCLGVIPFTIGEHVTWLNTRALELVGISRDTPAPPGCEIVKDPATGEPTGLLKGAILEELVTRVAPRFTREQKRKALLTAMKELNSLGITSITEGALGPGGTGYQGGLWDAECIDIYNDLSREGKLTMRVGIMMLLTPYGSYSPEAIYKELPKLRKKASFDNKRLKIAGVKLFADGIPLNKTAWMYEEYVGGGNGNILFTGKTDEERCNELMNIVAYSHKLGIRIGVHVTGDRAIDACINSFIKAEKEEPKGLRHYLIHGDFVSDEVAKRMAEYNIGVSVQPALTNLVMNFLPNSVGRERALKYGCLRTMLNAGVHVAGGSDAPVTYPDWKQAIQSIVLRDYAPAGKSVRHVTVKDAIRMFTMGGAWQDHMEDIKGSIEEGKLADFCVLDEDILTFEPHRLKDIRILMTIVGGEIVYDAGLSG
jgi:hypothetical protein